MKYKGSNTQSNFRKAYIPVQFVLAFLIVISVFSCSTKKGISKIGCFSATELALIQQGGSATPMRVLKINNTVDSLLLRTVCQEVVPDSTDQNLALFIDRLFTTVRDSMSMGVGIAAPQVGILKQIIWVQRFDKEGFPFEVYLNPKIINYSAEKQDCKEGCLSIPDRSDTTKTRSESITITYDRPDQSQAEEVIEGFTAVIFQHEIDHLHGILYLDHLEMEISE